MEISLVYENYQDTLATGLIVLALTCTSLLFAIGLSLCCKCDAVTNMSLVVAPTTLPDFETIIIDQLNHAVAMTGLDTDYQIAEFLFYLSLSSHRYSPYAGQMLNLVNDMSLVLKRIGMLCRQYNVDCQVPLSLFKNGYRHVNLMTEDVILCDLDKHNHLKNYTILMLFAATHFKDSRRILKMFDKIRRLQNSGFNGIFNQVDDILFR